MLFKHCRFWLVSLGLCGLVQAEPLTLNQWIPYTTVAGDSYIKIAQRHFENPSDWTTLLKLHPIRVPQHLQPGVVLQLPVELLKRTRLTARVVALTGQVTLDNQPLRMDALLSEGAQLKTFANSFVTLELSDHSRIAIPSNSEIRLERLRQYAGTPINDTRIVVQKGKIETQVSPQPSNSRFEVQSPLAVAGVRGTQFRVGISDDGTSSTGEVLEGQIALSNASRQTETTLPATYGAVATAQAPVSAPIALLPAPVLLGSNAAQDDHALRFVWTQDSAQPVVKYRALIARDATFNAVIQEHFFKALPVLTESHTPDSTKKAPYQYLLDEAFPEVDTGEYYIKVTAIDHHGLEGLPAIQPFSRRLITPSVMLLSPAPNETVTTPYFTWRGQFPVNITSVRYHFQLARTPDFQNPLRYYVDTRANQLTLTDIAAGVYYWRVAPIIVRRHGTEEVGPYSPPQQVTLQTTHP